MAVSLGLSGCTPEQKNVGAVIGLIALMGFIATRKLPDSGPRNKNDKRSNDGDT